MKTLIIGAGQVGSALEKVLSKSHDVFIRDVEDFNVDGIEILHICYPDHPGFEETTKNYIEKYKPKLTIINSSVSVGSTDKCGAHVIYSPIRGRHPKLEGDLKIYTKFIFGDDDNDNDLAEQHFYEAGIKVIRYKKPRSGELLKLISNVHMGVEIAWRQEVERMLKELEINPNVYETWERTYRDGYFESGDFHLARPSMKTDPIGGHCILPCVEILKSKFPSRILDFIIESNEKRKGEQNGI